MMPIVRSCACCQMSCIDRCVGKFLAAQEKTGTQINEFNAKMAAMQQAAMQQQQAAPPAAR